MGESSPVSLGLRAVPAGLAAGLMVLVSFAVASWVENYAVHLCRWPATISCRDGWDGWQLASVWFGLFVAVGFAALALFVVRGVEVMHLAPILAMVVGFPVLVLASGPRQLGFGDLIVFGAYGTYAVFLSWQTFTAWWPKGKLAFGVLAIVVAIIQLGVIGFTPTVLGDVAERNGLTRSPLY